MNNTRKKLVIQIGTQEHVIAVFEPDLSRWVVMGPFGEAYLAFAAKFGITDFDEAGSSIIRVADA